MGIDYETLLQEALELEAEMIALLEKMRAGIDKRRGRRII